MLPDRSDTTTNRLRAVRTALGLTQEQMAEALGLGVSAYKMRESRGRAKDVRHLPLELVERAAAAAASLGKHVGDIYALAGYDVRTGIAPQGLADHGALRYRPEPESPLAASVRAWTEAGINREPWLMRDRGLVLAGILPGDIAIVDLSRQPFRADDVVLASLDGNHGWPRSLLRLYRPPYLIALTQDESLLTPILLDDTHAVLRGRVVAMVREVNRL